MAMDAITIVRLAFLGPAAAILLAYSVPALRTRFLAYGARATTTANGKPSPPKPAPNLLDSVAALTVPHAWFTSFYYTCVTCTLLWSFDYAFASSTLASHLSSCLAPTPSSLNSSPTFPQTLLTWLLVLAQGSRRLWESHIFSRPSASRMWIGHWALGIVFYSALSTATFVESIPVLQSHKFSVADFSITAPTLRTLLCLCGFAIASGVQHDCHAYLFSLKKPTAATGKTSDYALPSHPAFNKTLTPHYFAECCIYLSLTFIAAPRGSWINGTMACALVFVVVNLGITAQGTREWYAAKFGREAVKGRARMVPFVF